MILYWHDDDDHLSFSPLACLSTMLYIVAKWHILQQKWTNRLNRRNTTLILSTSYTGRSNSLPLAP